MDSGSVKLETAGGSITKNLTEGIPSVHMGLARHLAQQLRYADSGLSKVGYISAKFTFLDDTGQIISQANPIWETEILWEQKQDNNLTLDQLAEALVLVTLQALFNP